MTQTPRVAITGASGRMGQTLISLINATDRMVLAGAIERPGHDWLGRDVGEAMGGGPLGIIVSDDAATVLENADAVIDSDIDYALWMSIDEIKQNIEHHRSPGVLNCLDDYQENRIFPMEIFRNTL